MARIIIDLDTDLREDIDGVVAAFESVLGLITAQSIVREAPEEAVFGDPDVFVDEHHELPERERFITIYAPSAWYRRVKDATV
jgi:hypothetical protein